MATSVRGKIRYKLEVCRPRIPFGAEWNEVMNSDLVFVLVEYLNTRPHWAYKGDHKYRIRKQEYVENLPAWCDREIIWEEK